MTAPQQMLKKKDVAKLLQVHVNTLDKMWQAGNFPAPFDLAQAHEKHAPRWFDSDVAKWQSANIRMTTNANNR